MSKKRFTKKQRQAFAYLLVFLAGMTAGVLTLFFIQLQSGKKQGGQSANRTETVKRVPRPTIQEQLLTPNPYSRPQLELKQVNGIVIHYVANPHTSAQDNRNYFEGLKDSKVTSASAHFIVGLKGEIVQCIPLDEIAYCSNKRNVDTISIECCHPDASGQFDPQTYQGVVQLTAWLCGRYQLTADQVIRHYDVTGKNCPKYYVEHREAWDQFRLDVEQYIHAHGE